MGVIYDIAAPNFQTTHQSPYVHEFTNEQPDPYARAFYDLPSQDDEELYLGCNYASFLYTTTRLLNIKTSHDVAQITFDDFVCAMKNVLPRENKLLGSFYD